MAKPPKEDKSLLDDLEVSLKALLTEINQDIKLKTEKFTLTDRMKVYDRILKLGEIQLKITDDNESSGFDDD